MGMNLLSKRLPLAGRLHRLLFRANLGLVLLLALFIAVMLNVLSARAPVRWHWNRDPRSRLSDRSRQILHSIPEVIQVHVLIRPGHEAYPRTVRLLREYAAASDRVMVNLVDPDRQLAEVEQLVQRYRLESGETVVFDLAGRHKAVSANDLVEYGYPGGETRFPQRAFRGEALFSSAIHSLAQSVRPAVFFIQGHGERSPLDFDQRTGASRIAARLREDNLDVDVLNLGEAKAVPSHCALMIVAGPVREFAPYEIALIRDYLDRKGRLLALLDARTRTGLESLLLDWGIQLGDDIVADPARTLTGRELYITAYEDHPVTAPLQGLASVFYLPRSVRQLAVSSVADKPLLSALAASSVDGWAEYNPDEAAPHFDAPVDIAGPVPVALAVERGPVPGVHVQIRPTRLVVVGDSAFITNGGLTGANADFFLNCVNWLLEREDLLAVSAAPLDEFRVVMDARQLRCLLGMIVLGWPGLAAAAGLAVVWRRRR